MNFCYPKKYRLLYNSEFKNILFKNNRIVTLFLNVYFNCNNLTFPRLGIIISKKVIRLSNDRNRVKRLLRESFRMNKKNIRFIDFLIFPKRILCNLNNSEIFKLLDNLWCKYAIDN
ncbi:ribonuclease P protein component [Candidatus Purcelliella pentastirinorum]|uniref:ribonuclease P protein component n=1 Tax=Candidatus Purcelliella pentastirinorum TaxID=472834 RepID=UPI0023684ACC|nr:ribonuclease P protein component [Candidatus Purcelliella pentastirinorum]WDI79091.1 ribonuclease P protein component [Candidatus Purcelliella pentastirinorum]WDR80230.1 ribonuclease P protein component [Candidatus Purcelliella pentastirinorum]